MPDINKILFEKIFQIYLDKDLDKALKKFEDDVKGKKDFTTDIYRDKDKKNVVISYTPGEKSGNTITICTLIGLPNEQFDMAEKAYWLEVINEDEEQHYTLKGEGVGGILAQYVGLMSDGFIKNHKVITYNSLGLGNLLKFHGNEFLGYTMGLSYYLNKIFKKNLSMDKLYEELVNYGVIKDDNISSEYRKRLGASLNEEKLKRVLYRIFIEKFNYKEEDALELIDSNFNPRIIERKMILIDKYNSYKYDIIINYITSENIPARLFRHVGSIYIVDNNLHKTNNIVGIDEELWNRVDRLNEDELDKLIYSSKDDFLPFILIEEEGNGSSARNYAGQKPSLDQMTNNLSFDYLKSVIKDIILELSEKDEDIPKKLFRFYRMQNQSAMLEVIKDRLRYSMYLQKRIVDRDNIFKSQYFKDNEGLLSKEDKIYSLDNTIIEQLEKRMTPAEISQLFRWELTGDGIYLILCEKVNSSEEQGDGETIITYHCSDSKQKFDNKEEKLKLNTEEPSRNRIYGSLKQTNYIKTRDIEYIKVNSEQEEMGDNDPYLFNNTKGVGFEIYSAYTSLQRGIMVDGQDIGKEYQEKEREEADIGSRTKSLQDTYFGENIILRYKKKTYGQLCGDLIYIYGSAKKDQLVIEGFINGDYGIELVEKARDENEDNLPITYTDYRVKVDQFEFMILDELEIKKNFYDHSRVSIKGIILEDNVDKYLKYLTQDEDPGITITYNNDDSKILFKGIVEDYQIFYRDRDYRLELYAVSYSMLLERRRKSRVFQNKGTTYNQVLARINDENKEFNIAFAKSSLGNTPLVSEDYPLVLQYKESEWDFIKRLATYLGQVVIVDDSKDDGEKINIQLGPHYGTVSDLNNIAGSESKETGRKDTRYKYYQVKNHEHYRSANIFEVGKKVNYIKNNNSEEVIELVIIQNCLHIEKSRLCSDFVLVHEDDVNMVKELRDVPIEGRSFRAEVISVNDRYQARVRFLDIDDDFIESKAYWFPIEQLYRDVFCAPEIGDIVDVYFKGRNEKYAVIKSSTTDEPRELDHIADEKLFVTPGSYQLRLNNEEALLAVKDYKSLMNLKEEEITLNSNKSRVKLDSEGVNLNCNKANGLVSDGNVQVSFESKGIKLGRGKVNMC